jgi:hypothetical protein
MTTVTLPPWVVAGIVAAAASTTVPVYDRVISVYRSLTPANSSPGIGDVGYSGEEPTTTPSGTQGQQLLFINIPCSIQLKTAGRSKGGLPSDIVQKPMWSIFIPLGSASRYSIRDRDIVTDDESYRYGVAANVWTVLGYQLECMRLEA